VYQEVASGAQEVASGSEPTQMAIPLKMELKDF